MMSSSFQEFVKLIDTYNGVILYKPLNGEVDYTKSGFPIYLHPNRIILPADKNQDPFTWVDKCKKHFKKDVPYILIPGTCFDTYGTRHGRGGGWYDRFLSKVPDIWLKIGITDTSKLSLERLTRKTWDQSVDWIITYGGDEWNIYKTIP